MSKPKVRGKFIRQDIDEDIWTNSKSYIDSCVSPQRITEIGTERYEEAILEVAAHVQLIRNYQVRLGERP